MVKRWACLTLVECFLLLLGSTFGYLVNRFGILWAGRRSQREKIKKGTSEGWWRRMSDAAEDGIPVDVHCFAE